MRKRIQSRSSEDEGRGTKNIYTNVQGKLETIPSSKDLELCLEVEMDDEVRELIKYPDKSPSTLLDVTVIKPKGFNNLYTTEKQTLNANLVKKMITSMKIDSKEKLGLMRKIFGDPKLDNHNGNEVKKSVVEKTSKKSCKSSKSKSLRKGSAKLDQGDVKISKVFTVYNQEVDKPLADKEGKLHQQVYAAPKTFNNIRSMFQCTEKEDKCERKEDGPNKMSLPCHCQNCAIVGILSDSQKVPFATEEIPPLPENVVKRERKNYTPFRRKSVTFKHSNFPEPNLTTLSPDHSECETILKQLHARVKDLEERVRQQEEKYVPKDYFKKIITKLVNHLTKLTHYTTTNEDRNSAKEPSSYKPYPSSRYKTDQSRLNSKFYVNHCQLDAAKPVKIPAEKEYEPKPCSSQEDDYKEFAVNLEKTIESSSGTPLHNCEPPTITYPSKYEENISKNESFWKWGGEILKPGIDLKNKIVVLLEEALQNFKKSWEKPSQEQRFHEDLQHFLQEISKNLPKTKLDNTKREKSKDRKYPKFTPIRESNSESSTLNWSKRGKKPKQPTMPRFLRKKDAIKIPETTIKVAYVNPEVKKWIDSQVSFKAQSSEELGKCLENEDTKYYKHHFLKIIASSKTTDKFKLWQSIWNQALLSGHAKNDTVTVQIPDPRDRQKIVKIDYTLAEIERMLISDHEINKQGIEAHKK